MTLTSEILMRVPREPIDPDKSGLCGVRIVGRMFSFPLDSGLRGRCPVRPLNLYFVTPLRHNRIIKLKGKMSIIFCSKFFQFPAPWNSVYKISSYCAVRGAGQASTDTRGCVTLPPDVRGVKRRISSYMGRQGSALERGTGLRFAHGRE